MGDINVLNERSPDVYFTMRTFDGANRFGYPGLCFGDNPDIPIGGGVHGGLHSVELNNLLILQGINFIVKRCLILQPALLIYCLPFYGVWKLIFLPR